MTHATNLAAPGKIKRTAGANRTEQRITGMKLLVAELALREMAVADVCQLLKFTSSSANQYFRDLRAAGVAVISRQLPRVGSFSGKTFYRISPDASLVRKYLAELDNAAPRIYAPRKSPARDAQAAIPAGRGPAVRDWAVAAIFGAAPAQGVAA